MLQRVPRTVLCIALLSLVGCGEILGLDDTDLSEVAGAGAGGRQASGHWGADGLPSDRSPLTPPTAGSSGDHASDGGSTGSPGLDAGGAGTSGPPPADAGSDAGSDGGQQAPP